LTDQSVKGILSSYGPKIVDKETKRREIYQAAMELFAQKGVHRTTIQEIAENAGIGKGTVYEYFTSKKEIMAASFQYMLEETEHYIARELQDSPREPTRQLRAFFNGLVNYLESMPRHVTEMLLVFWAEGILEHSPAEPNAGLDEMNLEEMYQQYIGLLSSILHQGKQEGVFRKDLAEKELASAMVGAMDGLMLQWIMFQEAIDIRKTTDQFLESIMQGILEPHR